MKIDQEGVRPFLKAFSLVPRKIGRRHDGRPGNRSPLDAARHLLLMVIFERPSEPRFAAVDGLFRTADDAEACFLYRELSLLPQPDRWVDRCRDGLRTNQLSVFRAISRGDYAYRHLPDHAWNQLVLKAAFLGEPLREIVGLDSRRNRALGRMLGDYISEREAAGRPVPEDVATHAALCLES
ncbi:MAG: EboA domain-containing protein [Planctomycetota bacterium]